MGTIERYWKWSVDNFLAFTFPGHDPDDFMEDPVTAIRVVGTGVIVGFGAGMLVYEIARAACAVMVGS